MRKLPSYQKCFVCGHNNQAGLNMTWTEMDEGVQGNYKSEEKHSGFQGIIHGGIISALLDECVGWAVAIKEKRMHFTGELNLTYKVPVPVDKELTIMGYYSEDQIEGKKYSKGHGHITDDQGVIYATAKGVFFPIPVEREERLLEIMENSDGSDRKVTIEDLWGSE